MASGPWVGSMVDFCSIGGRLRCVEVGVFIVMAGLCAVAIFEGKELLVSTVRGIGGWIG